MLILFRNNKTSYAILWSKQTLIVPWSDVQEFDFACCLLFLVIMKLSWVGVWAPNALVYLYWLGALDSPFGPSFRNLKLWHKWRSLD